MLAIPDNTGYAPINTDPHTTVHRSETGEIEAVRHELAAWSVGKPKAVQNAVASLDGWLEAAERVNPYTDHDGVIVADCVKRAVETLRAAIETAPGRCARSR